MGSCRIPTYGGRAVACGGGPAQRAPCEGLDEGGDEPGGSAESSVERRTRDSCFELLVAPDLRRGVSYRDAALDYGGGGGEGADSDRRELPPGQRCAQGARTGCASRPAGPPRV